MPTPTIKIAVSQADATLVQTCTLTAGMQNTPVVRFTFSDEWDNLGKMAVVRAGSSAVEVLVVNNQITIPVESVAVAGVNLIIGVYGANTSIVIPTVWCSVGEILDGTTIEDADNNAEPTASDVAQMLEYAAAVESAAETLKENVITEAEAVDTNANQYGTASVEADLVDASDTGKKLKLTFENLKGNGITNISYSNSGEYKGRINIATDANPSGTNYDALIEPIAHFEEVTDEAEESALKAEGFAIGTQDGEPSDIYAENNAFYFANLASEYAEDANDAQSAAEDAQEAAETAQGLAEDAATSASSDAGSAAGSASAAADSATAAAGSATEASGFADIASDAKDAAEDAQTAAETAQSGAETQALKSEGYAVGTQNGSDVASGSTYYHNNSKYYSEQASSSASSASGSATSASTNALKAEGFAVGEQNGTAVASGSPYYHNNAEYYASEAADSATDAAESAEEARDYLGYAEAFVINETLFINKGSISGTTLYI